MLKYSLSLILSSALYVLPGTAQSRTNPSLPPMQPVITNASESSPMQNLEREQNARLFMQRQAQLRVDTAKLVALTAELKDQVDKTGINILSMDVVKKAQQIQKLAKSVQDKMKNGY